MSCKTTTVEILPITTYELKNIHIDKYDVEVKNIKSYEPEAVKEKEFWFQYCVSFRDPSLPEWILARWWWNDKWVWTADGIWYDN